MSATDLGYGRGWLNAGPAASIRRIDRQIGHALQITEAGRTWGQQNVHYQAYRRYLAGGPWAPIALSPDAPSIHQLGAAIDSDEAQKFVGLMEANGWKRTVYRNGKLVEPWHFEYSTSRDQHRNDPEPAATAEPEQEEEDMKATYIYSIGNAGQRNAIYAIAGNGMVERWDSNDGQQNTKIAAAFDLAGPPVQVSESQFDVTMATLGKVRSGTA